MCCADQRQGRFTVKYMYCFSSASILCQWKEASPFDNWQMREKLPVHHQTWILSDDMASPGAGHVAEFRGVCWARGFSDCTCIRSGLPLPVTPAQHSLPLPGICWHWSVTSGQVDSMSFHDVALNTHRTLSAGERKKRQPEEINKQIVELMRCALMQDDPLTAKSSIIYRNGMILKSPSTDVDTQIDDSDHHCLWAKYIQ